MKENNSFGRVLIISRNESETRMLIQHRPWPSVSEGVKSRGKTNSAGPSNSGSDISQANRNVHPDSPSFYHTNNLISASDCIRTRLHKQTGSQRPTRKEEELEEASILAICKYDSFFENFVGKKMINYSIINSNKYNMFSRRLI